jgi:glycosyltransferase involved in cell wall biosynthesis
MVQYKTVDLMLMISIVVPFKNSQKTLKNLLISLLDQDFPKTDYEIVLVDDGSSDGSLGTVEELIGSSMVRIKIRRLPESKGCFHARNKGVEASEGEIIAFIDSDEIADKMWLRRLVEPLFEHKDVSGVSGKVITDAHKTLILPVVTAPIGATGMIEGVVFAGTGNVAYRKSTLLEIGGFDETFDPKWRGDSDLCLRVLEMGLKIIYEPDAIVYHPARKLSLGEIWKEGFKRYKDVLLYSKHRKNSKFVKHPVGNGFTKPFGRFSPLSIFIFASGFLAIYLALQSLISLLCLVIITYITWLLFFVFYGYKFVSIGPQPGVSLRFKAALALPFYLFAVFSGRSYGCIKYRFLLL